MTSTFSTRRKALKLGLAATLAAPAVARAQQGWPPQTITWVNPFPAGGGTDVFARPLAAQVGEQLGCQIIIDNKGGAGGTVGASQAAKMKPDGSVFFVGAIHHTIAPSIYKNLDYDLEKNFEPITMVDGIGLTEAVIANGSGCLAAQLVAHFKDGPGGIYLEPTTAVDCGQDYEYHIATHGEGVGLTITCQRIEGLRPFRRKKIFDGGIEEFKAFCEKEDA